MNEKDQILKLYDTGATVEVIAQAMEMPRESVHAILFENCAHYKRSLTHDPAGKRKPLDEEMLDLIADVARSTKNEFALLAAAKYVRNDIKGRLDAEPVNVGLHVEIIQDMRARQSQLAANRRKFLDVSSTTAEPSN